MPKALIVIDVQNDYFPGGKFPLWNTEAVVDNIERAILAARAKGIPIVHIQHVTDPQRGSGSFFLEGTEGVQIHPRVLGAAPDAPVVVKHFADGFYQTTLEKTLADLGVDELLICGMMTQNCVTHTALSKSAEKYKVCVLTDCCTTLSEIVHKIALNALSIRIELAPAAEVI